MYFLKNIHQLFANDTLMFFLFIFILVSVYFYYKMTSVELKCIVSNKNGKRYCVRDRTHLQKAAGHLAHVSGKCRELINYMEQNQLDMDLTRRLKENFNEDVFTETLPTSEYEAFSENKGEQISLCLNKNKGVKEDDEHLIDLHTLMFVALHELSHICTISVGHDAEFWNNFRKILTHAKSAGIHEPIDYSKKNTSYCGMNIHDNPYFEHK